jgi:hypothetical protein
LERGRFIWPQATDGTALLTRAQLSNRLMANSAAIRYQATSARDSSTSPSKNSSSFNRFHNSNPT